MCSFHISSQSTKVLFHYSESSSKRRKVEDEDMILPLTTRVRYIFFCHISRFTISYACMDLPIYMDPCSDAWKEGLAHLLGLITTLVILLVSFVWHTLFQKSILSIPISIFLWLFFYIIIFHEDKLKLCFS
jgi:hypothetical protein